VAAPASAEPSKSQIDKAGRRLKKWLLDPHAPDLSVDQTEMMRALRTLNWFRYQHEYPLRKTTVGLRGFVGRETIAAPVVAQRLKRLPTIINKLARQPSMALTRMEDIGGCRAIIERPNEVDGVVKRIRRNWDVVRFRDYRTEPKETGYRAVHVIVRRDGRMIEIQLRSPGQHRWAAIVEQTGARLRFELKDGEGPPELVRYFSVAADMIALQEAGENADEQEAELLELRPLVRGFFTEVE
jgi:putative GTP pyrophosphokinase